MMDGFEGLDLYMFICRYVVFGIVLGMRAASLA